MTSTQEAPFLAPLWLARGCGGPTAPSSREHRCEMPPTYCHAWFWATHHIARRLVRCCGSWWTGGKRRTCRRCSSAGCSARATRCDQARCQLQAKRTMYYHPPGACAIGSCVIYSFLFYPFFFMAAPRRPQGRRRVAAGEAGSWAPTLG
jgi:hypothetical protein